MSKVGERKISVPEGVQIEVDEKRVFVKGQEGEISLEIPEELKVIKEGQEISVQRKNDSKKARSLHGLFRTLINNAVIGVLKPWEKRLEVVGTGYGVKKQGEDLVLKLGYSHLVTFKKVEGIKLEVKGNKIIVRGANKQLVGEVAAKIRSVKKPDSYKGKGIRYEGEVIKLKPGKKAKVGA